MKSKRSIYLLVLPALVLGILFYTAAQINAVANASVGHASSFFQVVDSPCYVIADNEDTNNRDTLSRVDFLTGEETLIGETGTLDVEAIAFQFSTGILFGTNGGQLGTLNLTTAAFSSRPNPVGSGNGFYGVVNMTDIDGLSFDPLTGILYGTHRIRLTGDDVLIQIDPDLGSIVSGAFGTGIDYVRVIAPDVNNNFQDIDDIAIDPVDGQMYAILNDGGEGDWLIKVDKETGVGTGVNQLGVDDMEGLSFNPAGQLMGTTGKAGGAFRDRLFQIDKVTGITDTGTSVPLTLATDYEGSDCLTSVPVIITPTPTATPVTPTEPTAVELLYFRVDQVVGDRVSLSWATASEIGTYGFNLYRSSNPDFAYANKIYSVDAKGGNTQAVYQFTDTVPAAGVWWYWLEEIETQGGKKAHGPLNTSVIGSANTPYRVFIPISMAKAKP